MAKYSKKAGEKVEEAMHEMKRGELKSGRSGKKVTSKKQAIAIGLSEARERGAKVPPAKKGAGKKTARKRGGAKKGPKKTGRKPATKTPRRTPVKRSTARRTTKKAAKKSTRKSSRRLR